MKKLNLLFSTLTAFLLLLSCSKEPSNSATVPLNDEVNDFVWKGLNSWYNWQANVPALDDAKDNNIDEYYAFLNTYTQPEALFDALLFDKGNTDRFSWIVDDYVALNNQFQGISTAFGFRLQPVQINSEGDIIIYLRFVSPNSPADNANIVRGDIINAIDGTELNATNYSSLAENFNNPTVTLSFVDEDQGDLIPLGDKTITAAVIADNPVYLTKVFNDVNGRKVGYLVYNRFSFSFNDELNDAFAFFKAQAVNELVLDLRLNGGGSVLTTAYLASMIDQAAGTDIFADLKFNSKHTNEDGNYRFTNNLNVYDNDGNKIGEQSVNRLNGIDRLYVLASGSTASASEMIINGLRPFMPVTVIGTQTYGKNVGSITLYDSPGSDYTDEGSANNTHLYAMQPTVFQIYNKLGQSDYTQGFAPDILVEEFQYWNNILPFGDENEVVLKAALDDIRGISAKSQPSFKYEFMKTFELPEDRNKFEKEMYLQKDYFQK